MTFKLKIGKKGYVILPKAIREAVGIKEGDYVTVEIRDGILLKPVRKVDAEKIKRILRNHVEKVRKIPDALEPMLGELAKVYSEEEFEA